MATARLSHQIDHPVLEDLAAEITMGRHPGIEDRETIFNAFTQATVAVISPSLNDLARAYRRACRTSSGREAANLFLNRLLEAEA